MYTLEEQKERNRRRTRDQYLMKKWLLEEWKLYNWHRSYNKREDSRDFLKVWKFTHYEISDEKDTLKWVDPFFLTLLHKKSTEY